MALQQPRNANSPDIAGNRYSERRAFNFVGGGTDPNNGNVVPMSRGGAAGPQVGGVGTSSADNALRAPAPEKVTETNAPPPGVDRPSGASLSADTTAGKGATLSLPEAPKLPEAPATPSLSTTKLGDMTADTSDQPKPVSTGQALGAAGLGLAGSYLAPTLGANLGSQVAAGVPVTTALGSTASNSGSLLMGAPQIATEAVPVALGSGATAGAEGVATGASGATASAAGGAGSALGGALGAGALSGLTTFGASLLGGEGIGTAAMKGTGAAIGSGIGFAIGNVVLPGIGGIVGSTLGSMGGSYLAGLFCHAAGTLILMQDGTWKPIEQIAIGDHVALGGEVLGRGEVLAMDIFEYRGTQVSGEHAVFEDGRWLRVKDSPRAKPVVLFGPISVYPLLTADHALVCKEYVCADFAEWPQDIGADAKLEQLNGCAERNAAIADFEFYFCRMQWERNEIERMTRARAAA